MKVYKSAFYGLRTFELVMFYILPTKSNSSLYHKNVLVVEFQGEANVWNLPVHSVLKEGSGRHIWEKKVFSKVLSLLNPGNILSLADFWKTENPIPGPFILHKLNNELFYMISWPPYLPTVELRVLRVFPTVCTSLFPIKSVDKCWGWELHQSLLFSLNWWQPQHYLTTNLLRTDIAHTVYHYVKGSHLTSTFFSLQGGKI